MSPSIRHIASRPRIVDGRMLRGGAKWLYGILLATHLSGFGGERPSIAAELDLKGPFGRRLSSPLVSSIQSAPFRGSLARIAETAGLNLWLDRSVDPGFVIDQADLGPTVLECLEQIAATQECVIFPLEGCVLVGRESRVHAVAALIIELTKSAPTSPQTLDVHWPALTTPAEAFQIVANPMGERTTPLRLNPVLPHDLWPEVRWSDIRQDVAAALILAQFDRQLTLGQFPPVRIEGLQPEAVALEHGPLSPPAARISYQYANGSLSPAARAQVAQRDPQATFRSERDQILNVTTTIDCHKLLIQSLLKTQAAVAPVANNARTAREKLQKDSRRFTLRLVNKPAGEVLASLANAAQVQFRVSVAAQEAAGQSISLDTKDASLLELIERVAASARLKVTWTLEGFEAHPL